MVKMKNSGIECFVEERDVKRFESMGYSIVIEEEAPVAETPKQSDAKKKDKKAGE